jgi:hypothetical protein
MTSTATEADFAPPPPRHARNSNPTSSPTSAPAAKTAKTIEKPVSAKSEKPVRAPAAKAKTVEKPVPAKSIENPARAPAAKTAKTVEKPVPAKSNEKPTRAPAAKTAKTVEKPVPAKSNEKPVRAPAAKTAKTVEKPPVCASAKSNDDNFVDENSVVETNRQTQQSRRIDAIFAAHVESQTAPTGQITVDHIAAAEILAQMAKENHCDASVLPGTDDPVLVLNLGNAQRAFRVRVDPDGAALVSDAPGPGPQQMTLCSDHPLPAVATNLLSLLAAQAHRDCGMNGSERANNATLARYAGNLYAQLRERLCPPEYPRTCLVCPKKPLFSNEQQWLRHESGKGHKKHLAAAAKTNSAAPDAHRANTDASPPVTNPSPKVCGLPLLPNVEIYCQAGHAAGPLELGHSIESPKKTSVQVSAPGSPTESANLNPSVPKAAISYECYLCSVSLKRQRDFDDHNASKAHATAVSVANRATKAMANYLRVVLAHPDFPSVPGDVDEAGPPASSPSDDGLHAVPSHLLPLFQQCFGDGLDDYMAGFRPLRLHLEERDNTRHMYAFFDAVRSGALLKFNGNQGLGEDYLAFNCNEESDPDVDYLDDGDYGEAGYYDVEFDGLCP